MCRASSLFAAATESSRSRITRSAPLVPAFAIFRSESPGANSQDRAASGLGIVPPAGKPALRIGARTAQVNGEGGAVRAEAKGSDGFGPLPADPASGRGRAAYAVTRNTAGRQRFPPGLYPHLTVARYSDEIL